MARCSAIRRIGPTSPGPTQTVVSQVMGAWVTPFMITPVPSRSTVNSRRFISSSRLPSPRERIFMTGTAPGNGP